MRAGSGALIGDADMQPDNNPDYIIVGAGSAGCALAEGLSRSGKNRVLVIEAGGSDRRFWIDVPLGYGKLFFDPDVNWCYDTEPDPGLGGRSDFWPRGKVLGGSSSINAMVYARGQAEDFDDWKAEGCTGWGFDDVLPVFKSFENNQAGADDWRGGDGPLHIADVSDRLHPLSQRFIAAGQALQIPHNPDFNGETQEGIGTLQLTISAQAKRLSAARAFLDATKTRSNVTVQTKTLTKRVVFDGKRAVGIEVIENGQAKTLTARAGVILCAGAVESPCILQRSGVGPGDILQQHGIDVVHENANVGSHLQDHLGTNFHYRSHIPTLNSALRPWWGKAWAGVQYLLARTGPLSLSINQAGGFVKSSPKRERPNIQLYLQALTTSQIPRVGGERPLMNPDSFDAFGLGLSSCRPKSRGRIDIASILPTDKPRIQPNSFSHPDDMVEMIEGARLLFRMAKAAPLAEVNAGPLRPELEDADDEILAEDFRARASTVYHPCGTCRMGADSASSVVSPNLKAHGLDGLHIADASIFPTVLSGNLNAASIMVGVRAATLIQDTTS